MVMTPSVARFATLHCLAALRCDPPRLDASDADLDVLSRRIEALSAETSEVQCLVLDAMVPRQRMELRAGPPFSQQLLNVKESGAQLAMLGVDPRQTTVLRCVVEARIEQFSPVTTANSYFEMVLIGGRRFELLETPGTEWPPANRLFPATVRWLDDSRPAAAAATERSEALGPLVSEWISLVRSTGRERQPDQIATLLGDLGPMPDAEYADDRALWVGALINPLPALGVALEIRPAVQRRHSNWPRCRPIH